MATAEQETQLRGQLEEALSKLSGIRPEDLVRREELGAALSFEGGVQYFDRILKLYRDLRTCTLDGVPYQALVNLVRVANDTIKQVEEVQQFSLQKYPQNALGTRDALIERVRDSYDPVYQTVTPHIAYAIRKGTDFEALENEARETLQSIRAARDEQLRVQKALEAEAQQIVESIRRAAAEAGVAQHAIHFAQEATSHGKTAKWWLVTTALAGSADLS